MLRKLDIAERELLYLMLTNVVAIEFYEENGFSYEKSVDKALSDFCNDKKTKKKIAKKKLILRLII